MASSKDVEFDDWKCQGKMALDFLAFSVIQKREKNEEEMRSIKHLLRLHNITFVHYLDIRKIAGTISTSKCM